jgi:3-methylcrotonyl-CoA carboxylase alpha subunit
MKYWVERGRQRQLVEVHRSARGWLLSVPGQRAVLVQIEELGDGQLRATTEAAQQAVSFARRKDELWLVVDGRRVYGRAARARPSSAGEAEAGTSARVTAPMPGKLLRLLVNAGQHVSAGQPLAVVEAMKMENELLSPIEGEVAELAQQPGPIDKGTLIAVVRARETA